MRPVEVFLTTCLEQDLAMAVFFGPVSAYFGTIETNGWRMLHFHCLVCLKRIFSFSNLHKKIIDKDKFKTRLLLFLDQIIKCELTLVNTN